MPADEPDDAIFSIVTFVCKLSNRPFAERQIATVCAKAPGGSVNASRQGLYPLPFQVPLTAWK